MCSSDLHPFVTVERAGEGAGERVRGVVGDGRWSGGGGGGLSVTVEWGRVRGVGGSGRWSGGDGAHEIQSRNEGYNLNTIDLS